jgi:hypothetical protein
MTMSRGGQPTSLIGQKIAGTPHRLGDAGPFAMISGRATCSGTAGVFAMKDADGNEIGMPFRCLVIAAFVWKSTDVGSTVVKLAKNLVVSSASGLTINGAWATGSFGLIGGATSAERTFEAGDKPGVDFSAAAADAVDVYLVLAPLGA